MLQHTYSPSIIYSTFLIHFGVSLTCPCHFIIQLLDMVRAGVISGGKVLNRLTHARAPSVVIERVRESLAWKDFGAMRARELIKQRSELSAEEEENLTPGVKWFSLLSSQQLNSLISFKKAYSCSQEAKNVPPLTPMDLKAARSGASSYHIVSYH